MRATLRLAALSLCLASLGAGFASAQSAPPPQPQYVPPPQQQYSPPPQQPYSAPPQQQYAQPPQQQLPPAMPATAVCSGKAPRSASTPAAKAPAR
jgi:hypothetical protein